MAKVDLPADSQGLFSDTASYIHPTIRPKTEKRRPGRASGPGKADFTSILEHSRTPELETPETPPVSEETTAKLLEEVRNAGNLLGERPFPQEILAYKQAVKNFMRYVVDNSYQVEQQLGIPQYLKPNFRGVRGSSDSQRRVLHPMIRVVDRRLEELAAALMKGQLSQLEILSRLEEIKGLLVDLIS
ncbi:MAG: YaaR family protein [Treponema sp.]|jgi:uncharacterized protein YaaR (DUF327 family)|nr:YaaR family protein [Treponema sp.]